MYSSAALSSSSERFLQDVYDDQELKLLTATDPDSGSLAALGG